MNVLTFSGNLGKDCRTGNVSGTFVANFSVAMSEGFGKHKKTVWVECAYWGKGAEAVAPYLLKGQTVVVSGEAGLDEGGDKYGPSLTCRVGSLSLVGSKRDRGEEPRQEARSEREPPAAERPLDDDDIPF